MENEWLDIACINHEKYILHGQIAEDGEWIPALNRHEIVTVQIEQTLTPEQKRQVDDLLFKHEREMREILRSFVA